MTLFSTGFFSLSEDNINNLNNPNVFEKNQISSNLIEQISNNIIALNGEPSISQN